MINVIVRFLQKIIFVAKLVYVVIKKKPYLLSFTLVLVVFLQVIAYIWQVNASATKGYQIKELESHLAVLKQQYRQYLVEESDLRSMDRIEKGVRALEMQMVPQQSMLANRDSLVAKR